MAVMLKVVTVHSDIQLTVKQSNTTQFTESFDISEGYIYMLKAVFVIVVLCMLPAL